MGNHYAAMILPPLAGGLHAGCPEGVSRNPSSCCVSAGCAKQWAPGLLLSQPDFRAHCTLLSSAACCQAPAAQSMLWRGWCVQSLHLSPEGNSSPFCKPKSLPLRRGFSFLWEGSCSCLLASVEFSTHSAPSQNIAQLSQSNSKN